MASCSLGVILLGNIFDDSFKKSDIQITVPENCTFALHLHSADGFFQRDKQVIVPSFTYHVSDQVDGRQQESGMQESWGFVIVQRPGRLAQALTCFP